MDLKFQLQHLPESVQVLVRTHPHQSLRLVSCMKSIQYDDVVMIYSVLTLCRPPLALVDDRWGRALRADAHDDARLRANAFALSK